MTQQPRHVDEKFGHVHKDEVDISLACSNSWPEAEFEEVTWNGGAGDFHDLRFVYGMRGQNYKAFVPPRIANVDYAPSSAVASLTE